MPKLSFLLLLLLTYAASAQEFNGFVFDEETAVENIEVTNLNRKITVYTNEVGYFSITAIAGDSVRFQSLFHDSKIMVLNPNNFKGTQVVKIKKRITQLGEVRLYKTSDSIAFEERKQTAILKQQIEADMERYPLLYERQKDLYSMDLIAIAGMISKLFKTNKPPEKQFITYSDLTRLFENSPFFSTELLTDNSGIPEKYIPLFFEYCEVQYFDGSLLNKGKELELLEKLNNSSEAFLKLLEENKNED